jgi:hypothetical protein
MLSGRFLEDVYTLNPLVLTIHIKWMEVCGSVRSNYYFMRKYLYAHI